MNYFTRLARYKYMCVRNFQKIFPDFNDIHRMPFSIKYLHVSNNILHFQIIFYIYTVVYCLREFEIQNSILITTVK